MHTTCVHEIQLHQAPRYACVGVMHIWVLYLDWAHAVDAVHLSHKGCAAYLIPYAASVTHLCLHWCSAQLSGVLAFSPDWSQGLCVESDEAVVGELGSASNFTIISWWHFMSILTCACIGVMHVWALYWNLGTYAVVAVHISHKVYLYHQMKQWSMSWAAQHFSSSADDVLWAEFLSQHPQHYMQLCSCAALYDHQVIMFHEHMSQSSAPYAASVTQLCLHWCSAQLSAVLTFSSHWSQGLCVESDKAVVGEVWSASYFTINWWCLISILTCACIGVLHIWALYRNLGTYAEVPVHISHDVCIIRFSSDWWSGLCSIFIINWWCFLTILSQSPLYAASVTTSSTQMCLHWFCAHLSAVLELGTYAAVVPVHISHKVCIIRFSSDWWSGMRSIFIINWLCVESDEAVVGELGSASYFTISWWCLMSILSCACIGVLHVWALYWDWAQTLL